MGPEGIRPVREATHGHLGLTPGGKLTTRNAFNFQAGTRNAKFQGVTRIGTGSGTTIAGESVF
jgi:hypothetical protein